MENKTFTMTLAGRELKIETGLLANQSTGSVTVSLGDTIVFASAVMGEAREGTDFFPLTVDFEEKYYAAGKIKGSRFMKREGRPSEKSVLNSRLIDRPIRPLFPKNMINDVQLIVSCLSADLQVDPSTTGLIAASAALCISGMPFQGPVAGVRVGLVNGELIINPTYQQVTEGQLDLVVAGTEEAITMVEAGAKEVDDETMLKALDLAHAEIKKICALQKEFMAVYKHPDLEITTSLENPASLEAVQKAVTQEMLDGVKGTTKMEVKKKIKELEKMLIEKYAAEIEAGTFGKRDLKEDLNTLMEKNMRKNILEKEVRLDGRKIDQIRPLSVKTSLLPRTHGSALFQRGETQSLSITTLGAPGDSLVVDTMDEDSEKHYFHHYNFPPFSVGEARPLRGPSRRDIGHGNLAERALIPVLPAKEKFPYTVWVVSEIMSCNGSSSMAAVCGSSLSLMDAGVPISKPVAGIAMGLVTYDGDLANGYKILTDIQGMEDFAGDMDFKVAGTRDGITALQMDIKVKGLSVDLLREAMGRAQKARNEVLDAMDAVISTPRAELSPNAPRITSLMIDPEKIADVIGKGGETIKKIIKETGVDIDIEQTGLVLITATTQEAGKMAEEWVKRLTYEPQVGEIFTGKVVKTTEFGAFVEFLPGRDGLVHISELDNKRIAKVEDVVKVGDTIKVKLIEVDSQGRYKLSHKAVL
ncbi:polyribonucleotide nucleotidyltransferase [Candidatus Peregrinibacteria bacterium]|nr:polyribonucleotide nucleotidyltransferase [Candidatus Peregrinibacteria bacterium]